MTLRIVDIQAVVCHHYGLPMMAMISARRAHREAHPRQVAIYLSRALTDASLKQIARRFERDHSTIIHAIRAVGQRADTDADFRADLVALHDALKQAA